MDSKTVSLRCPNCGSSDITLESEKLAVCKSCGGRFAIAEDNGVRNIYVTNEVHMSEGTGRSDHENRTVENVVDAVTVMRNVFIDLADDPDVPEDIFDSDFGAVVSEIDQYLCADYDVSVTYSASVGYDRKETYYDRNSRGELVEKTRTVTDWQPFNGHQNLRETGIVVLRTTGDTAVQCARFGAWLDVFGNSVPFEQGNVDEEPLVPSKDSYNEARMKAESRAETACRCSLPGDRHKDFRASSVSELNSSTVYVIPDFVLPYKYKGNEYSSREYSCSTIADQITRPSDKANKEAKISAKLRPFIIPSLVISVVLFITSIVFIAVSPVVGVRVSVIPVLLAASICLFVFANIKRKRLISDYVRYIQQIKIKGLERLLAEKKLSPLTGDERASVTDIATKAKAVKFKNALYIVDVIAFVVVAVMSFIALF